MSAQQQQLTPTIWLHPRMRDAGMIMPSRIEENGSAPGGHNSVPRNTPDASTEQRNTPDASTEHKSARQRRNAAVQHEVTVEKVVDRAKWYLDENITDSAIVLDETDGESLTPPPKAAKRESNGKGRGKAPAERQEKEERMQKIKNAELKVANEWEVAGRLPEYEKNMVGRIRDALSDARFAQIHDHLNNVLKRGDFEELQKEVILLQGKAAAIAAQNEKERLEQLKRKLHIDELNRVERARREESRYAPSDQFEEARRLHRDENRQVRGGDYGDGVLKPRRYDWN